MFCKKWWGWTEQTGHPDLESDRQTLEPARRLAALWPAAPANLQTFSPDLDLTQAAQPDAEAQLQAALSQPSPNNAPGGSPDAPGA